MKNLKLLSDEELLAGCDKIVKAENKITKYAIAYFAEIDRRRMFSKEHESLSHFLTKRYGYTSGSAQRRIDAVKLYREIPEVAEKIESGDLKLEQITQIQVAARQCVADVPKFFNGYTVGRALSF